MSQAPRRRWLLRYWAAPAALLALLGIVVMIASLDRADTIARLADEIAHGKTENAAAAVRQLAEMKRPPLGVLVGAARSADSLVAGEAQRAIDAYLDQCEVAISKGQKLRSIAAQLKELAAALKLELPAIPAADQRWVESTTRMVLQLANQLPAESTTMLAADCDAILSRVSTVKMPAKRASESSENSVSGPAAFVPSPIAVPHDAANDDEQRRLASLAAKPWSEDAAPANGDDGSIGDRVANPLRMTLEPPPIHELEGQSRWQTEPVAPIYPSLPAAPIHALPIAGRNGFEARMLDGDRSVATSNLGTMDSRTLLKRWLIANSDQQSAIQKELAARGLGRPSRKLASLVTSDDENDRKQLVDDLMRRPGAESQRWLLFLADDPSADVRLAVVTVLATSRDAAMIEKAWQIAVRDHDPRVAALASRLQERRNELQRR